MSYTPPFPASTRFLSLYELPPVDLAAFSVLVGLCLLRAAAFLVVFVLDPAIIIDHIIKNLLIDAQIVEKGRGYLPFPYENDNSLMQHARNARP
jgi:hypothetical protein